MSAGRRVLLNGRARSTRPGAIRLDASRAGISVLGLKALGEVGSLSSVRFVGRAPSELDAGDERVVVDEVFPDEGVEPGEGVELVEVEPAMAKLAPEGLDHGVRVDSRA